MKNAIITAVVSSPVAVKNVKTRELILLAITRENCTAELEKLGTGIEKMEKQSAALVTFATENGVDLTAKSARQDFISFFVNIAFEDKKWTENPSKKGFPAVLDMVRSGGMVKGEQKALVSNTSRKIAKAIYAAWQYVADNKVGENKPEDSLKKIAEAIAGCNTRLEKFTVANKENKGTEKIGEMLEQAQADLTAAVAKILALTGK